MPHAWIPHWDWPNYTLSGCGIELCGIQLLIAWIPHSMLRVHCYSRVLSVWIISHLGSTNGTTMVAPLQHARKSIQNSSSIKVMASDMIQLSYPPMPLMLSLDQTSVLSSVLPLYLLSCWHRTLLDFSQELPHHLLPFCLYHHPHHLSWVNLTLLYSVSQGDVVHVPVCFR